MGKLESATVTLNYKEFKDLVDKAEQLEELIEDFIEEKEDKKEVEALNNILDLLVEASKCKTSEDKQNLIEQCIEIYSTTFEIPLEELINL